MLKLAWYITSKILFVGLVLVLGQTVSIQGKTLSDHTGKVMTLVRKTKLYREVFKLGGEIRDAFGVNSGIPKSLIAEEISASDPKTIRQLLER